LRRCLRLRRKTGCPDTCLYINLALGGAMCLLALFFRVVEDAPVVLGANREEYYARGGEPPRLLDGPTRVVAGIDSLAGGTWLGVSEHGVVVAVTNRPKSDLPSRPRSRGLLARELLNLPNAESAAQHAATALGEQIYAGCNFLLADPDAAYVIHAGDWLRVRPLPPGIHVMTAHDVNDASDRRIGHSLWWLHQRNYLCADDCLAALRELCAQSGGPNPPICLHGDLGGTVSSSVLALRTPLSRSSYWHAQGPPDRTPYENYSQLVRGFGATAPR
jgi:hypothetical protein